MDNNNCVEETLKERGGRYGSFDGCARIAQVMKDNWQKESGWERLNYTQRQALEVISDKVSRIINGDPNYEDSWVDIAGYAVLAANSIRDKEAKLQELKAAVAAGCNVGDKVDVKV